MAREVMTREAFETPYRHPYRHWIPRAWEMTNAKATMIGGILTAASLTSLGVATGMEAWIIVGGMVDAAALGVVGYWTAGAAMIVRRSSKRWREPSELRNVREHRPHRGERDPELAHDEYAVSVEAGGELYTWRMRPLPIDEAEPGPDSDWVLVPGVPEYVGSVVESSPYDPLDAARAAEQLAAAQDRAAALEADARNDARRRYEAQLAEGEIAEERRGTAAALQRITGQGR